MLFNKGDTSLYIYGGQSLLKNTFLNDLLIINTNTYDCKRLTLFENAVWPSRLYFPHMCFNQNDNKIVLLGGKEGKDKGEI